MYHIVIKSDGANDISQCLDTLTFNDVIEVADEKYNASETKPYLIRVYKDHKQLALRWKGRKWSIL